MSTLSFRLSRALDCTSVAQSWAKPWVEMTRRRFRAGFLISTLCLVVGGCTATRQEPFVEGDFAKTSGPGSGVVSGHAYAVMNNNDVLNADQETVVLTPVTSYTTENVQRRFMRGENLHSADRRIDKYLRSTTTDGQGNFSIGGIPAGDYYVETEVNWTTSYQDVDNDGIETTMHADHHKLIYARVSVGKGQRVRVNQWDQSSPIKNSIYAYGGTLSRPHHQTY